MALRTLDDGDASPQDLAARAAWLYYVGGMRQDQIADEAGQARWAALIAEVAGRVLLALEGQ